MNSPEHFRRIFDEMGYAKVRERFSLKQFGGEEMQIAALWLREQEEAQQRAQSERSDASQAEQISIARSAKDAAWEAAREAKKANRLAIIANAIAVAAMIVGGIALIQSMRAD